MLRWPLRILRALRFIRCSAHIAAVDAYAGPGAGFAVLSSFWTLFVAFLYSVYALFTWPFRQLLRMLSGARPMAKRRSSAP